MEGLTRSLAEGTFLVYIFVAVVYITLVVWFIWSCCGPRYLIEIVVLALNSHTTQTLDNTCVGVSRFTNISSRSARYQIHDWPLCSMIIGPYVRKVA